MTPAEEGIYFLSNGKRTAPRQQMPADGKCGICDDLVPPGSRNLFYCPRCMTYKYAFDWHQERGFV